MILSELPHGLPLQVMIYQDCELQKKKRRLNEALVLSHDACNAVGGLRFGIGIVECNDATVVFRFETE